MTREIIEKIDDELSELQNNISVSFNPSNVFNLNSFISESNFFFFDYTNTGASSAIRFIFLDPVHSTIVLDDTTYKTLSNFNLTSNNHNTSLTGYMYYNELPIEKTDDVPRVNKVPADIYIDCAPADDANGESIIQYIKKPFASESLKNLKTRQIAHIFAQYIVFCRCLFSLLSTSSYMKLSSASNSNSS